MTLEQNRDAVKNFLDNDDWNYQFNEENGCFEFALNLECKLRQIKYFVDVKERCIVVYAVAPLSADSESCGAVAEYLTRVNYGLLYANFEMDYNDGEVRLKDTILTEGLEEVPFETVSHAVYMVARLFEQYGNGLAAVMMGFSDPETEVEKAEAEA